jgi:hypothetical protein
MNWKQNIWLWVVGLVLGFSLGLYYAWKISPVKYVDTVPLSLKEEYKDAYRLVVGSAYLANGDLARAQARLTQLGDTDPLAALAAQAQRMLAAGQPPESIRPLAGLAAALKGNDAIESPTPALIADASGMTFTPPPDAIQTATGTREPTPTTNADTPTALPTTTPRPTRTPTPTMGAPFVLASQETLCNTLLQAGVLQVFVNNSSDDPVAGAEIVISWNGGENHFFTGLKPELGDGYADFLMTPGTVYAVRLAAGGSPVTDLTAPSCKDERGETFWGGIRLIFKQP